MKNYFSILFGFFILLSLSSCKKEKLDVDSLTGSWKYSEVQYTGNFADSTTIQSGIFTFKKSTETLSAGGTVYGEELEGIGDFPALFEGVNGEPLADVTKEFKLSKQADPSNYNYKNFYTGIYAYKNFSQQIDYGFMRISMKSKDEIVIRLEISQNNIRFNVRSMVLKRM